MLVSGLRTFTLSSSQADKLGTNTVSILSIKTKQSKKQRLPDIKCKLRKGVVVDFGATVEPNPIMAAPLLPLDSQAPWGGVGCGGGGHLSGTQ